MVDLVARIDEAAASAAVIGHWLDAVHVSLPLGSDTACLGLGWKLRGGGLEPHRAPAPGVTMRGYSKPADTLIGIPRPGEREVIAAAWRFGAPDLVRTERRPLPPNSDPREDKWGLTRTFGGFGGLSNAFGYHPLEINDGTTGWMVEAAAAQGFVSYLFRPGRGWIAGRETRTEDPSLDADGHRCAPVPAWATPEPLGIADATADGHQAVWTFSRGHKFISLERWRERFGGQDQT
ncbi:hypothetical protein [Methylobacterium nodulans]|uniref:Uncharacterized protein n=1 Tax=Methylobacterium nodulans (strain LMG 21967 / CNCM I-2342 / ORS 2060) TaxID=460265 RepID=B8IMJ7_METNO|nr:hypothetical protein [Methylobacterium nodulans]ACL58383.1 hypothetical protein Mnod_3472 [Methylobacterium nodulans ORS 2060]